MNAQQIPYTPPPAHETARIRSAIERKKARENARDAQRGRA